MAAQLTFDLSQSVLHSIQILPRDIMQVGLFHHGVCPSVCVCVCVCLSVRHFVNSVKTSKHIFKTFMPSGSHTILVYPYKMS